MSKNTEQISGVYQIRNIKTNKVYIGSSIDIYKRFKTHLKSLQNKTHHSTKLQRSYNASKDKSIFILEIIEVVEDTNTLKEREQYYIDKYDSFNTGYNCSALTDNPKYTEKGMKKARRKIKQVEAYKTFWELYDDSCILIGNVFISRIKDKHYDIGTINKLITIMRWFYNSYNKSIYKASIIYRGSSCWLDIYDLNENRFASYGCTNGNIYHSHHDTEIFIDILKQRGLFDPNIHVPVDTKMNYSMFRVKEKVQNLKRRINYVNSKKISKDDFEYYVGKIPAWEDEIHELCSKYNLT